MGLSPKGVDWNVRYEGEILKKPLISFTFPAEMEEELGSGLHGAGCQLIVVDQDPVQLCAADPNQAAEKYVAVKWMPPRPMAIGVVDTDETEFVALIDFGKLKNGKRFVEDAELVAEVVEHMMFVASELNRIHEQFVAAMRSNPNVT